MNSTYHDEQQAGPSSVLSTVRASAGLGRDARRGSGVALSSVHLFLTTLVTSAFGYLYWIAAAHLFSDETVGHVSVLVSVMLLITQVGSMGIGLGLAYVLPQAEQRWSSIVNTSLLAVVVSSALVSGLIIAGAATLHMAIGQVLSSGILLGVFVLGSTVWTVGYVLDQILTVERATSIVLLRNSISAIARLAILPGALLLGRAGATGAASGLFGAWGVSAALSLVVVIPFFARSNPHGRRLAWRIDHRVIREVVPLSLSNHILTLIFMLPGLVLPLVVSGLLSTRANAYFYTTWMVATILFTIPVSTSMSLFAQGAARQHLDTQAVNKVLGVTLAAVLPLAIVVGGAHTVVLSLFGAAYVEHGSGLLMWLAAAAAPLGVCSIYVSAQRIRRHFRRAFGAAAATALLTLLLVVVVIKQQGLTGVGAAVCISYAIVALFCLVDLYLIPHREGNKVEFERGSRRPTRMAAGADIAERDAGRNRRVGAGMGRRRGLFALVGCASGSVRIRVARRFTARTAVVAPRVGRWRQGANASTLARLFNPAIFALVAAGLWGGSLRGIDVRRMNDLGLISVFPPSLFVALGIVLVGFCLALRRQPLNEGVLLLHVLLLIIMLYGTTALVEAYPRFEVTWRHIGFTEYIMRTGQSNGALDAYFNWPTFFILSAFTTRLAGLPNLLGLVAWAPVFFNILYLGPLLAILKAATADRRLVWLGAWFFYLTNWIGQDYFSPQAFNFFLNLTILALLLTYFAVPHVPSSRPRVGVIGLLRRLGARWEESTHAGPAPLHPLQRAALIGVVMALYVVSVASHQLTPFATLASVTALCVFNKCRARSLPVFMVVVLVTWLSFMTVPYLSGHLGDLTKNIGSLHGAVTANLTGRLHGSPQHTFIVRIRLFMTALVWGGALLGVVRLARRRTLDLRYALVALAPFPLLILQPYGGEMLLRVYLFASPAVVFLLAALFYTRHARITSWRLTGAVALMSAVLLFSFLFARFGNEKMDYMTTGDVNALGRLYATAKPGALLVGLTSDMPWKYKDFEQYHYATVLDLDGTQQARVFAQHDLGALLRLMHGRGGAPSYLVITRSQEAQLQLFYGVSAGQIQRLDGALVHSSKLRMIYNDGTARIFVPRAQGTTERNRTIG